MRGKAGDGLAARLGVREEVAGEARGDPEAPQHGQQVRQDPGGLQLVAQPAQAPLCAPTAIPEQGRTSCPETDNGLRDGQAEA